VCDTHDFDTQVCCYTFLINMKLGPPRRVISIGLLVACAALAVSIVSLPGVRYKLLRAAGQALVANDEKQRVDVIVIAIDADGGGVLEAADLVNEAVSTRVAVFEDPPDPVDRELIRRGAPYYDAAGLSLRQLNTLGVTSVAVIRRSISGTTDEAALLPRWCSDNGYHSVLVITSPDHARRARRTLQRAMRGSGVTLLVRASRYSEFDPDGWWQTRVGVRTELVELEKLLLDVLIHP
jgi:uncharacterized SAM-binding protein YcdF (DUF218 family)